MGGAGRAIAVAYAREGAAVVCADRDEGSASATAALISGEGGIASVAVGDAATEDGVRSMVAAAAITAVVYNVGIASCTGNLAGTEPADWDVTMAANLRGAFLTAREALPLLSEGGSFVFIGSIAGLQPGSRLPAYDASKAGLIGLCRHVALEGARRGVRANVVAPG